MQQPIPSQPVADRAENWSHYLPGFQLTHIIHLVSARDLDVVSHVAAHLQRQQASVSQFTVSRSGQVFDQTIVLDDIGEERAEALRAELLALDGVLRIRLEHRFVRATAKQDDARERPSNRLADSVAA